MSVFEAFPPSEARENDGSEPIDWGGNTARARVEHLPTSAAAPRDEPEDVLTSLLNHHKAQRFSLHREKPSYAKGHLETIRLEPGEALDLDGIHREWGGGTIRFRAMDHNGKFCGRSACLDFSGPPLYHGQPIDHRGQPLGNVDPVIDTTARERVYGTGTRSGVAPTSNTEALRVMGDLMSGLMDRLDRMEERLAAPPTQANPSDPTAVFAQLTTMAKTMNGLKKLFADADDFAGVEEEEATASGGMPSLQEMLPMLLLSQMGGGGNGQQGGQMNPLMVAMMAKQMGMPVPPPPMAPQAPPQHYQQPTPPMPPPTAAPPPRPPQAPPQAETIAPSQAQPAGPPDPQQMAALLQRVPPEQRGAYVAEIMQAMGVQVPGAEGPEQGGAAGAPPASDPFANGGGW